MAGSDKTATWTLDLRADGKPAAAAAADMEKFRSSIATSTDAIKSYQSSLRALRGTSDEVRAAKESLKIKIEAERDALSRNNLAILKLGTTYGALSKKTRDSRAGTEDMRKALTSVGGPISSASDRLDAMRGVLGGVNPALTIAVAGLAAVALAFAVFTSAVVAGTVALSRFILASGNTLRAQGLMREAVTLGADDAARLGRQIDALADKLATPKEKLNELAVSIRKTFDASKLSGQGIVDTFQAVASASEAAGDDVGRSLLGILERSKRFGRVGINPFELRGTGGPSFEAIAKNLALQMHTGVEQATRALRMGLVPINTAAAAIRDAVNAKFGSVNAKKMLDINVIAAKFHENLIGLAKGIGPALEPILAGLKSMADLFSQNTVQGAAIQSVFTSFATVLSTAFTGALPHGTSLIKQAIIWALKFGIVLLEVAQKAVDFGRSTAGIVTIKTALVAATAVVGGLTVAFAALFGVIAVGVAVAVAPIAIAGAAIYGLWVAAKMVFANFKSLDWAAIGANIVHGIRNGIESAKSALIASVSGVATDVKNAFKGMLGIHSPSAVFAGYGRQTSAGFAQGVEQGAPDARQAVTTMVHAPDGSSGSASAGSHGRTGISVVFQISGTGSPEKTSELLQSSSVLDAITRAIEIAARGIGAPTQSPMTAVG